MYKRQLEKSIQFAPYMALYKNRKTPAKLLDNISAIVQMVNMLHFSY